MSPLLAEFIGAVVRWLLTAGAASLVTRQVLTADQATRMVDTFSSKLTKWLLIVMSLVAPLAWSLWQKYWARLKLRAARELPAGADDDRLRDRMRDLLFRSEDA